MTLPAFVTRDLQVIPGLGPRAAEQLRALGVHTPEDLTRQDAVVLASHLHGYSARQVRRWQHYAQTLRREP